MSRKIICIPLKVYIYKIMDCRLAKAREMSQGKEVNILSWAPLFIDKDEFQESLFFFLSN